MPSSSADRDPLEVLAEDFVERFRAGERPSLTEYARRMPDREEEIRDLFPALVEMEQLKPVTRELTTGRQAAADSTPPAMLGDFRIIGEVGKGGMGIVYEAVQESLGRHVALKVLPAHAFTDPVRLERFRREAKAAAKLHHTNIVPIFGTGEADGRYYYAMQFIRGHALDAVIDEVRRLKEIPSLPTDRAVSEVAMAMVTGTFQPASAESDASVAKPAPARSLSGSLSGSSRHYRDAVVRLGIQVADALAYAHEQGVVHRDIKPSNLLLDLHGTAWVTDFGLAKANDSDDLTHTGDIIGTLRYMAPERFDNQGDHRADIYALGLTLYELLTHKPAYSGNTKPKLMEQVLAANPAKPRSINPSIPRDLETIVLKAIERDPALRYQSAREMEDDLKRFHEDRPIQARRASRTEQAWRWCRRNPAVAGLLFAVIASLLAGAGVSLLFATRARSNADESRGSARRADENAQKAQQEAVAVEIARAELSQALADSYGGQGLAARDLNRPAEAAVWFAEAAKTSRGDAARETANRGWVRAWLSECFMPVRALPPGPPISQIALSPNGRYLIARHFFGANSRINISDLRTETAWPTPEGFGDVIGAAWNPTGTAIALGTRDGKAGVFEFPSGKSIITWQTPGAAPAAGFSPDGNRVAIGGASIRVWDLADGKAIGPDRPHPAVAFFVEFAPDGMLLLTRGVDNAARLFPLTGDAPATPTITSPHVGNASPHLADNGKLLIVQSRFGNLAGLDTTTGKDRFTDQQVNSLADMAVTTDGLGLWTAERDRFMWRSLTGVNPMKWHFYSPREMQINSIAVSANGWVAGAGADRKVEIYFPHRVQPFPPLQHTGNVRLVAISADASTLVTVQEDGLTRVWTVPARPSVREVDAGANPRFARFSPTGRYIIPSGGTFRNAQLRKVQLYDATNLAPFAPAVKPDADVFDVDISPDETTLATIGHRGSIKVARQQRLASPAEGAVRFWKVSSGEAACEPLTTPSEPRAIRFRPDGKQVAVVCAGGEVVLIDPVNCKIKHTTPRRADPIEGFGHYFNNGMLRYSADGGRLYIYGFTWGIAAIDPASGRQLYSVPLLKNFDLQPSPDGTILAVSCQNSTVRFIDAATGKSVANPLEHPDWVFTARFSPDGARLLTACRDGSARTWDWRAAKVLAVLNHSDQVWGGGVSYRDDVSCAEFTPDGRLIVTGSLDKSVRVWDSQTGRPAAPPIRLDQRINAVEMSPNGQAVLVGGVFGGKVHLINIADLARPDDRTAEDLLLLAEVVAGERLAPNGALVRMTNSEWRQRFAECRRRGLVSEPANE